VAPQLTAEAKRAIATISEGSPRLQPHVDALLTLRPAVAQFDRGVPHSHSYTVDFASSRLATAARRTTLRRPRAALFCIDNRLIMPRRAPAFID
jgi:hypothetical protein